MPVNTSEIVRKEAERNRQLKRRLDAKKEREQEQREKESEEAEIKKKEFEAHSEMYKSIQGLRLVKGTPGGSIDSGMVNYLLGDVFDEIRDLKVEIKELRTQLGFTKEIKKDIRALEIKVNGKEIDMLLENL